jgi:hypothetical protein
MKPAAKVARVDNRAAVGFSDGKNLAARMVDKLPKM